jgi:hypothetical protein
MTMLSDVYRKLGNEPTTAGERDDNPVGVASHPWYTLAHLCESGETVWGFKLAYL